jgi:hypothetical protein
LVGFDKEILYKLPYRYIEKTFFQIYLSITPSDPLFSDLIDLLLSIIVGTISFILLVIKKENKRRHFLFTLSFIITAILSFYIALTRNNFYSVKLQNCYESNIKFIDFDGKRKIKILKPNEKKWIIYSSDYPNKKDNTGETWHTIHFKLDKSRHSISVFTLDAMKTIKIPDDNDNPGGVQN